MYTLVERLQVPNTRRAKGENTGEAVGMSSVSNVRAVVGERVKEKVRRAAPRESGALRDACWKGRMLLCL